jgi:outer membrane protein TolC
MPHSTNQGTFLLAILLALAAIAIPATAQDLPAPFCEVVIHDESAELEDARIAVDLAKSSFAAYEKIFKMIEGLWGAETIPRMDYLKAKYDCDAARLALEGADLILERQAALVEQYRLICNRAESRSGTQERASAIRKAYLRYRRADCGSLAKAIDVAATKLEYNREYLKSILDLRRAKFATNTQVVLAELDVEREEKSLTDAKQRTALCRSELADLERGARASSERETRKPAD